MFKLLFVTTGLFLLSSFSCGALRPDDTVKKVSPSGAYKVELRLWQERKKGTTDYLDHIKLDYFKGQQIIYSEQMEDEDVYERSVRESSENIDWVADNVLRMGTDPSGQPFNDEFIIRNNTNESLKYVGISYGKYQHFRLFDVAPGSQLRIQALPDFKQDGTSNYFLGYAGRTESGKRIEGTKESKQRKSPADGPMKFEIPINATDLQ